MSSSGPAIRARTAPWGGIAWLLPLVVVCGALSGGCSRQFYRQQADREVYGTVVEHSLDPRSQLPGYTIQIGPQSRMFDPYNPDLPPLPPDDPLSHQYMHRVDGKRGYPFWHRNGDAPRVDAGTWRRFLPEENDDGYVRLDIDAAVQLAYINSREYQRELENLYLSALDVTFQRFRFDAQFFGGNDTAFTADGPNRPGSGGRSRSVLNTNTGLEMHKLYPAGGELVVGVANSLVWQFSGPNSHTATTLLDFSVVQPLLRFGGRARVMEGLTLAERNLLANVRQMDQFRQGFYTQVVTGRDGGSGPVRNPGSTGVGGGGLSLTSGAGGGYLGLLQDQQQIRNLVSNVAGLRKSLAMLQELHKGGRVKLLQVEQARQALNNGQSRLLAAEAAYQTRLDAYKLTLGLPPDLNLLIEDELLEPYNLINPDVTALQGKVDAVLDEARALIDKISAENPDADERLPPPGPPQPGEAGLVEELDPADRQRLLATLLELETASNEQVAIAQGDLDRLYDDLDRRRADLARITRLAERGNLEYADLALEAYTAERLLERVEKVKPRLELVRGDLQRTWEALRLLHADPAERDKRTPSQQLVDLTAGLSNQVIDLSLVQALARLDSTSLIPVEMNPADALETARWNRRDWMNARAALVDVWRRIEFDANALKSGVDIVFSGDMTTTGNNPVRFNSDTGRLRAGLRFDAPLTRLAERNQYRESLIAFQRARRDYMLFEDRLYQGLRNTLRFLELNQLNFELRRAAVEVAITQVDLALEALRDPQQQSPTAARDVVSAFADLLDAQNNFLAVGVSYEVLRRSLDFELGTMQLNDRGIWIDPGPITADRTNGPENTTEEGFDFDAEPVPAGEVAPLQNGVLFGPPPLPGLVDGSNSNRLALKDFQSESGMAAD